MSRLTAEYLMQMSAEIKGMMASVVVRMEANAETLRWLRSKLPVVQEYPPLTAMPLHEDKDLPFGLVKMVYGSGRKEIVKITEVSE